MDRLTKAIVFWTNQILVTKRWWCRGLSRTEESQHLSMERTSSPSHEIQFPLFREKVGPVRKKPAPLARAERGKLVVRKQACRSVPSFEKSPAESVGPCAQTLPPKTNTPTLSRGGKVEGRGGLTR